MCALPTAFTTHPHPPTHPTPTRATRRDKDGLGRPFPEPFLSATSDQAALEARRQWQPERESCRPRFPCFHSLRTASEQKPSAQALSRLATTTRAGWRWSLVQRVGGESGGGGALPVARGALRHALVPLTAAALL